MTSVNLETRKLAFVQDFLRLQNEEIVSGLEKFLRTKRVELLEKEFKSMDLEQYNAEIDQAMEDSKNGRMIKATDLKEKFRNL